MLSSLFWMESQFSLQLLDVLYSYLYVLYSYHSSAPEMLRPVYGEKGWHSCDSDRLPPMLQDTNPGLCVMWVEFVVGSSSFMRGFFSGSPVFLSPIKLKATFLIRGLQVC